MGKQWVIGGFYLLVGIGVLAAGVERRDPTMGVVGGIMLVLAIARLSITRRQWRRKRAPPPGEAEDSDSNR